MGDESRVLGRGDGPPADLVGEPRDSRRQLEALEAAVAAALASAGIEPGTRVRALVAGISGHDAGHAIAPPLDALAETYDVVHDTVTAHAGALDGGPGIVVIAGTGSVALGNADARDGFVRCGGWGYFFGDEGGALWIARVALRRAMAADDRTVRSELGARACAFFGALTLRAVQHAFARGDLARPALAAFASEVLALAAEGDGDACDVREQAARELAALARAVDARLGPASSRNVSYAGGLFRDAAFTAAFGAALARALPVATLARPVHDAATGALALARSLVPR